MKTVAREANLAGRRWGAYYRISEDPLNLEVGVKRQARIIAERIAALNAEQPTPNHIWPENDTSAFKRKATQITDQYNETRKAYRVIRPQWAAALRALRSGEINALMVYDLDRLARDPLDLEDAIEAVEHFDAVIYSASASEIDLNTESGRMLARVLVLIANKASADTARRVVDAHRDLARQGVVVGGNRPFGFMPDKITHHPQEAALIRDAARKILSGQSLHALAREWSEDGVKTSTGAKWSHSTLRQMFRSPRLVGYRVYRGEVALNEYGQPARLCHRVTGELAEPILDQETFDRVQVVLEQRGGLSGQVIARRGSRKYLLSGLLLCGSCFSPMYGNRMPDSKKGKKLKSSKKTEETKNTEQPNFVYKCNGDSENPHTVTISGPPLDEFVRDMALRVLADMPMQPETPDFPGNGRLEELDTLIRETFAAHKAGQISSQLAFGHLGVLEKEVAALKTAHRAYIEKTSKRELKPVSLEEWEEFGERGIEDQRGILDSVLECVFVHPGTNRRNTLDPDRLEAVWIHDYSDQYDEAEGDQTVTEV